MDSLAYGIRSGKKVRLPIDIAGKVDQKYLVALLDAVCSDDEDDIENFMCDSDTEFEPVSDDVQEFLDDNSSEDQTSDSVRVHQLDAVCHNVNDCLNDSQSEVATPKSDLMVTPVPETPSTSTHTPVPDRTPIRIRNSCKKPAASIDELPKSKRRRPLKAEEDTETTPAASLATDETPVLPKARRKSTGKPAKVAPSSWKEIHRPETKSTTSKELKPSSRSQEKPSMPSSRKKKVGNVF